MSEATAEDTTDSAGGIEFRGVKSDFTRLAGGGDEERGRRSWRRGGGKGFGGGNGAGKGGGEAMGGVKGGRKQGLAMARRRRSHGKSKKELGFLHRKMKRLCRTSKKIGRAHV